MKKYIIHWFPFCSGGICDRILGLASSICIANVLDRDILIRWDHGDLSDGFNINQLYDWYQLKIPFKHVNLNNLESIEYFKTKDIIQEWGDDNIMIWSNINLFNYTRENEYIKHLFPLNYLESFQQAIEKIFQDIFIINPEIITKIPVYDIGIHIRTGDKQIYDKQHEEFYKDYITNILKNIKGDIRDMTKTIFISSDCLLTFKIAKDFFKDFKYHEGIVVHTSSEEKGDKDGIYKVFLDLLTLCKCKSHLYVGWNSNFSRIASLYNPNRKFICYEYENIPNQTKECSSEVLFSYFSWGK